MADAALNLALVVMYAVLVLFEVARVTGTVIALVALVRLDLCVLGVDMRAYDIYQRCWNFSWRGQMLIRTKEALVRAYF